jgi:release factor glutamine methyltransferase
MSSSGKLWTVVSMLEWATNYFEKKGVDNPRLSIEWLLADMLGLRRLDIYLKYDRPLSPQELEQLKPMIQRRALHEPLQHITGSAEFMGITLKVNRDVLIPRQETEQLVELILNEYPQESGISRRLLDLGTGSGCIPIAVKNFRPGWICAGMDISEKALKLARENAVLCDTEVGFYTGDMSAPESVSDICNAEWDIVVSNPPYIKPEERDTLDPQVREYEPEIALFHENPAELYEKIAAFASTKNAGLFLELNNKIAEEIREAVLPYFRHADLKSDYDGNPRFLIAP